MKMKLRTTIVMMLILAATLFSVPARASVQEVPVQKCIENFDHHDPASSPYYQLLQRGKLWINKLTGQLIAAVMIAECGKFLIGIYGPGGTFVTHYLVTWEKVKQLTAAYAAATWDKVRVVTFILILVPCPGSWTNFTRPCSSSTQS